MPHAPLACGDRVIVRLSRGRGAARMGIVIDLRALEGVSSGRIVVVRWDDDRSLSWIVPGTDVEIMSDP